MSLFELSEFFVRIHGGLYGLTTGPRGTVLRRESRQTHKVATCCLTSLTASRTYRRYRICPACSIPRARNSAAARD